MNFWKPLCSARVSPAWVLNSAIRYGGRPRGPSSRAGWAPASWLEQRRRRPHGHCSTAAPCGSREPPSRCCGPGAPSRPWKPWVQGRLGEGPRRVPRAPSCNPGLSWAPHLLCMASSSCGHHRDVLGSPADGTGEGLAASCSHSLTAKEPVSQPVGGPGELGLGLEGGP